MAGVGTSMGQMPRLTSEACEDLYIKLHIRPLRSVHMLYEHLPRECRACDRLHAAFITESLNPVAAQERHPSLCLPWGGRSGPAASSTSLGHPPFVHSGAQMPEVMSRR